MHYFEHNFSKILKKISHKVFEPHHFPPVAAGHWANQGAFVEQVQLNAWTSASEGSACDGDSLHLSSSRPITFFYSFRDWSRTQYFFRSARATLSPPAAKLCGRHQPRAQGAALFPLSSAPPCCAALRVRPRVPTRAAIDTFLFRTALCFSIKLEMSHFVCLVTVGNPPRRAWASQTELILQIWNPIVCLIQFCRQCCSSERCKNEEK